MNRGVIPINKDYELEYRYYEKDQKYRYFNRKFEIYLIQRNGMHRSYMLHMDNCDTTDGKWAPHIHKKDNVAKKLYFGVTTLNWNDIKENFTQVLIAETGPQNKNDIKKAVAKLLSPKL
ncbi:MAG: hypothetical protein QXL17_03840 [Candidatus Thermoplasmatota archaeon]